MLAIIIAIVAIVIVIVLVIAIFFRSRRGRRTPTTNPDDTNCEMYGWRMRWFLVSGNLVIHPFQWMIDRVPEKCRGKMIKLLDNKLKYYKRQINFESETDLNESIDGCNQINDELSVVIPLEKPDEFKEKMEELDRLIIDQHRNNLIENYQSSEDQFKRSCETINGIVKILPSAA
jgi:hypothetical protein